jgi:hypothetical protein
MCTEEWWRIRYKETLAKMALITLENAEKYEYKIYYIMEEYQE